MSAFIVDYKTIDNILSIRLNHGILTNHCYLKSEFQTLFSFENVADFMYCDANIYDYLEQLGKEFLKLNIDSVYKRYPELKDKRNMLAYADDYKFKCINYAPLGQAIKSLDCLMYQSSEIDNYKENETYKKMEKLRKYLVEAFLGLNDDYKNAAWSDCY